MNNSEQQEQQEQESRKRKQKPGLNAVRPEDWIEEKFKEMANDHGSQTKFFERIFLSYLQKEREDKKEEAISFSADINLLSQNLSSMLQQFKNIASKAQNTLISQKSNYEQHIENIDKDLETERLKNTDLSARNLELQSFNEAFTKVKSTLEEEIESLKIALKEKDEQFKSSKIENSDILKQNKTLQEENTILTQKNSKLESENKKIIETNDYQLKEIGRLKGLIQLTKDERKEEIEKIQEKSKKDIEAYENMINEKFNIEKEKIYVECDREKLKSEKENLEYLKIINEKNEVINGKTKEIEALTKELDRIKKQKAKKQVGGVDLKKDK